MSLLRRIRPTWGRAPGDEESRSSAGLDEIGRGVRTMGIKGMSLLATLAFVLASPGVANAETVRVTGTETEGSGRTCGASSYR